MVKNNTTHEQAEKLIELGIDINTADMHFHRVPNPNYDWDNVEYLWDEYPKFDPEKHFNEAKRPCWSLAVLFDMLPNYVDIPGKDEDGEEYVTPSELHIGKTRIAYKHYNPYQDIDECDMQCYGDTFFDCVYNAVCWLLETKLI